MVKMVSTNLAANSLQRIAIGREVKRHVGPRFRKPISADRPVWCRVFQSQIETLEDISRNEHAGNLSSAIRTLIAEALLARQLKSTPSSKAP
jgi:hypothetical protein